MTENQFVTKMRLVDSYKFDVDFDVDYLPTLVVDEPKPAGKGAGPNPPRMLATAIGHCMSTSLIFCLNKARIPVKSLETTVKTNLYRNEKQRLRIKSIDLEIKLEVNEKDKQRVHRCLDIFEDYCTVTQSIRKGIEVNVNIN